jgi:hypothetical protein
MGPERGCLAFSSLSLSIEHVFVNWFKNDTFASHAVEWLALAVVILLALELCTGTLEFVSSLFTHERDAEESEKHYWRIHSGE